MPSCATSRSPAPTGETAFRVIVAIDHRDITAATDAFAADAIPSLVVLAILLIAALWLQITVGLAPLARLRSGVADIISGRATRLSTEVPTEVGPLVAEINSLLGAREQAIAKARSHAADLAHGMKTPLQVLAADVRTLREKGEAQIADEIDQVATTLKHHVERELARARIGAAAMSDAALTNLRDAAVRVVGVVERTPRGRELAFVVDVPAAMTVAVDEADLIEVLGNLVENACRFAKTRVAIGAQDTSDQIEIAVVDDGPGIPEAQRDAGASARHPARPPIGGERARPLHRGGNGGSLRRLVPPRRRGARPSRRRHDPAEKGLRARQVIGKWSEREDLNLRPPEPHSGALPDCATLRRRGL